MTKDKNNERTHGQYRAEVDCVNALRRLLKAVTEHPDWGSIYANERGTEERAALEDAEDRLYYYEQHGALKDEIDWTDDEK